MAGVHWHFYCDESGDMGFDFDKGASIVYTVSMVAVDSKHLDSFRQLVREAKREVCSRGGALEWKRLNSSEKANDDAIARFFDTFSLFKGSVWLLTTVISNKFELRSESFRGRDKHIFLGYTYGLAFKRIRPFLGVRKDTADVFIDRNSNQVFQENVSRYLAEILPTKQYLETLWRWGTKTETNYSRPKFASRKNEACHQFADFCAGYARAAFTRYLESGNMSAYQNSWSAFKRLHTAKLDNWNWDGLLYQPYESRMNHVILA